MPACEAFGYDLGGECYVCGASRAAKRVWLGAVEAGFSVFRLFFFGCSFSCTWEDLKSFVEYAFSFA
jgi:hypothetical protein